MWSVTFTRWRSDMSSGYCPVDPELIYWGKAGLPLFSKRLQGHPSLKGKGIHLLLIHLNW